MPFAQRLWLVPMTNLAFAQQAVRLYNEDGKQDIPLPTTCQEFLNVIVSLGYADIEGA
jgi:hypothetical protein